MPKLSDYATLCTEAVANLPEINMAPFLVADSQATIRDFSMASYDHGIFIERFRKNVKKIERMWGTFAFLHSITQSSLTAASASSKASDMHVAMSRISFTLEPQLAVLPDSIRAELHPLQDKWIKDNIYLVFGFYDRSIPLDDKLRNAIGTALVMLDRHVIEAGNTDPSVHTALNVSVQAASDFQSVVGDMYKNRTAIWHSNLQLSQIVLSSFHRLFGMGASPKKAMEYLLATGVDHHVVHFGK
jgi:hypothetical protein